MRSWFQPPQNDGEWVDKHEAARLLACDERTIDRYRERGLLTTHRYKNWYVRFKREEVERLRDAQGPVAEQKKL